MRFLVYGAGAVGGVVGARLYQADHDVTLLARGEHAAAIRTDGLRLESPNGQVTLPVPVIESLPSRWPVRTVVLLAVKSQHTRDAVDAIARVGPPAALCCLQNGVNNERVALRSLPDIYGICVMLPAEHLEPGVVTAHSTPTTGMLDIGRYPSGVDGLAVDIASAFSSATLLSEARPDIMRWKYRKLVMNLGNAVQALCGVIESRDKVIDRLQTEATACFEAAGIEVVTLEEDRARRADHIQVRPVEGRPRAGGSSYQSLERRTGSIEVDYLNGEICLLGRLYGVPTPANAVLQRLANEAARLRQPPGSLSEPDLLTALDAADGGIG